MSLSFAQENEFDVPVRRRERLIHGLLDAGTTVVGNNLFERTNAKLSEAGVKRPTVVRESISFSKLFREHSSNLDACLSAWEQPLAELLQQGCDTLVLIGSTAYNDLDYQELLRFHMEREAGVTQVCAADGALEIAVISPAKLRGGGAHNTTPVDLLSTKRERFFYDGYVNRLRNMGDFMQLVEDALYRRCALRPAAAEVANGLWIADNAEVDDSCIIGSPAFVGANTRIAACSNISGGSAIESACHIDSATVIKESWILPDTYVGVGLNVNRSIVSRQKMFHLDRRTEITVNDRRLIGSTRSFPLLRGDKLFSRTQISN
jgi:hypothetical protein